MACTPITSWQIDGETMETVRDFIFLDSKITSDDDCGHEIKRCLLLGRQAMTNLDSILKSRDITLLTEVYLVKALVFPVVMYRCESWTIKKKLIAKESMLLNCVVREDSWESLGLQGNSTSQSYRKSVLNIHWNDWCWSWNSNSLSTWRDKRTPWKRPWCWERLTAGGEGTTRMRWLEGITDSMDMSEQNPGVGDGQGSLVCCSPWSHKESYTTERLTWTEW